MICRWDRLKIDKRHWHIELEASNGSQLDLVREEIFQIFKIVQRIVHLFRNNLIQNQNLEFAFKGFIFVFIEFKYYFLSNFAFTFAFKNVFCS